VTAPPPGLAGLSDAEEFFGALGVPYDPRVLDAHRLHVMKTFGLALGSWLEANPEAAEPERWQAAAGALRAAYEAFAEEGPAARRRNPFAPGLVQLGRPRPG
jgi:nitrogenase-stabilizing/protective protein